MRCLKVSGINMLFIAGVLVCTALCAAGIQAKPAIPSELVLVNSHYRMRFQLKERLELKEIYNKALGENLIDTGVPTRLFEIGTAGMKLSLGDFQVERYHKEAKPDGKGAVHTLTLLPRDGSINFGIVLRIETDRSRQVRLGLAIRRTSDTPVTIDSVFFPYIQNVRIGGSVADDWYFCPVGSGFFSNKDIETVRPYGGGCWWQVFDVYDEGENGGLYTIINDSNGRHKNLVLKKNTSAGATVFYAEYPFPTELTGGSGYVLPQATLGVHTGGWRTALADYMKWVKTWYHRKPTPSWFKNVFFIRQEALHGREGWLGGYNDSSKMVLDAEKNRYRFKEKIEELSSDIKVEYFHLNGWWEGITESVGDYAFPEYRGGNQAFRDYIRPLQQAGVNFGLYWEGTLVSKDSETGRRLGSLCSIKLQDGSELPDYGPTIWKLCPAFGPWQDFLVNSIAETVRTTGVRGVYIDNITSCDAGPCFNAEHHHPNPGVRIAAMGELFSKIRRAIDKIDPQVALYSEEASSDYISQFLDGSFCHRLWVGLSGDPQYNKPQINLFRFYFPDFKFFEWPAYDIRPDKIKLALFNGDGFVVQVVQDDSAAWRYFRMTARVARVLQENADAFTTDAPEALVPTLVSGVYANRFPAKAKVLHTVYNSGKEAMYMPVLKVESRGRGFHYVDIANLADVQAAVKGKHRTLKFKLMPGEVTCIAELPSVLGIKEVSRRGSRKAFEVTINQKMPGGTLEYQVIKTFRGRDVPEQLVSIGQERLEDGRTLIDIDNFGDSRLVVKLKKNGLLVDALVVH